MRADVLGQYETQVEIQYEGENYAVRDNGAVCRTGRPGSRKRRLDDVWTFGRPSDSNGYMYVGSHVVHRIVALAFHEQPSRQHVVDHIDGNRRNNRADNLRWVTRLENVLLNPITRRRVLLSYGSLDAFFKDPSAIATRDPHFSWMRTVTREEAEESRNRLLKWAGSDQMPKGGELGEWLYGPRRTEREPVSDKQSLTPMAIQRKWNTLSEFPACPDSMGADPLSEYADRLKPRTVFCRNTFGETLAEVAGGGAGLLAVVCRMPESAVKEWALSKITVENGKFIHESVGTFFTMKGALNGYNSLLGIDAPHQSSVDDFC